MKRIAVDAVWLPALGHGEPSVMRMTGLPSRTNTVVFTSLQRVQTVHTGQGCMLLTPRKTRREHVPCSQPHPQVCRHEDSRPPWICACKRLGRISVHWVMLTHSLCYRPLSDYKQHRVLRANDKIPCRQSAQVVVVSTIMCSTCLLPMVARHPGHS